MHIAGYNRPLYTVPAERFPYKIDFGRPAEARITPTALRQTYFEYILNAFQASQLIAETTVWSPKTALTPAVVRSTSLTLNTHYEAVTILFYTAEAIIERSYSGA